MVILNKKSLNNTLPFNHYIRRLIAMFMDMTLCIICTWLAFSIMSEHFVEFNDFNFIPAFISIAIAIPIFWYFGLYRTIFSYTGLPTLSIISKSSLIYGVIYFFIISIFQVYNVSISIGVIQPMLLFLGIVSLRIILKYLLTGSLNSLDKNSNKENVLIYGAGSAGRQLLISLDSNSKYRVIGFLDDNSQLYKQILLGKKIYDPTKLDNLIKINNINLILFAIPSINKLKKDQIIKNINKYKLSVKFLPNVNDIIDGKVTISDIKDYLVDDLLDREQVNPGNELLNKNITSKTVMVTGGGGSIGSELCRQIIKLQPLKLVLIELNEFALYKIHEELLKINKDLKIIPLLCNVQDQEKLEKIIITLNVDTIYHAAAYKHVPLVEENICEGVKNNVFGTFSVAKASIKRNVSNLVLISSDKAVRPTNIMGASKRLAELCMQALHDNSDKTINTNFSIVRFGNVLETSGSVIPKFKQQIREGGPITLTHPDVSRYFMTITEAAQLVIQAGALGKKSEVFVLDMGKSVKIREMIKRMVNLSGLKIQDEENSDGDIKIELIGLRPGEKLYEELLIGDNPQKTIHPKIQKAQDPFIPYEILNKELNNLWNLLKLQKADEVKKVLENLVSSYKSNSEIVDHIFTEETETKY